MGVWVREAERTRDKEEPRARVPTLCFVQAFLRAREKARFTHGYAPLQRVRSDVARIPQQDSV